MRHLFIFTTIALSLLVKPAATQPITQAVKGRVVDADTKNPVRNAAVVLVTSTPQKYSMTNARGYFKIAEIALGRHTLHVSRTGYKKQQIKHIAVDAGKQQFVNIALTKTFNRLQTIHIKARGKGESYNAHALTSAKPFTVEETRRFAGSLNDPARMAAGFAGVTSCHDGNNSIIVRGNSPKGLQWRLEGVEIPNPNHFHHAGASGGAISMLSIQMMANSDFYTGAFPAEFGNALSGVFDIRLRNGNRETHEYSVQAGIMGIDMQAEGPLSKKHEASWVANYRYSTVGLLKKAGIEIPGHMVPVYQDFSYKLHLPAKKAGTFQIWGLNGTNSMKSRNSSLIDHFASNLLLNGISHKYILDKTASLHTVIAFSSQGNAYKTLLDYTDSITEQYKQDFTRKDLRFATTLNKAFSSRIFLKAGLNYSGSSFGYQAHSFANPSGNEALVDCNGRTGYWQLFANSKMKLTETLTWTAGLHLMLFNLNNQVSLQPRTALKYEPGPNAQITAAAGLHSRLEPLMQYFARVNPKAEAHALSLSNKNLGFSKAVHAVAGYKHFFTENLQVNVEAYFQKLYMIPVDANSKNHFSILNSEYGFSNKSLTNKGTGKNYGIELTVKRSLANHYYFRVNGSLYNSVYKGSDQILRNTCYNGNYAANALFGKEFVINTKNRLAVNVRLNFAGGRRYTPIDEEASRELGYAKYNEQEVFEEKASDYFRADLQIRYKINRKRITSQWSLEIQNATNRLNQYTEYYNPVSQQVEKSHQLGLIPVINYKIAF